MLDNPDVEFIDFVWFDAALLLTNAEDFERAETLLIELLDNDPDDERAAGLLADLKELRGDKNILR